MQSPPPIRSREERHPFSLGGDRISDVGEPVNPQDVATRSFVEASIAQSFTVSSSTFEVSCPSSIQVGQLLKSIGDTEVELATCLDTPFAPAIGIKLGDNLLQVSGVVLGIFGSLSPGAVYFLGPDGWPTKIPYQIPPNTRVFVQKIGVAISVDKLLLAPSLEVVAFLTRG